MLFRTTTGSIVAALGVCIGLLQSGSAIAQPPGYDPNGWIRISTLAGARWNESLGGYDTIVLLCAHRMYTYTSPAFTYWQVKTSTNHLQVSYGLATSSPPAWNYAPYDWTEDQAEWHKTSYLLSHSYVIVTERAHTLFNCHAFAVGREDAWVVDAQKFYNDDYVEVPQQSAKQSGDIVAWYTNGSNTPFHSSLVLTVNAQGQPDLIEEKQGFNIKDTCHLSDHSTSNTTLRYYRRR